MYRKKIKKALKQAVFQLPMPSFEKISNTPVTKLLEHDFITTQEPTKQKVQNSISRVIAVVCVCCGLFFAFGMGWFAQNCVIDSKIMLDVNPSIEITTNHKDCVLEVKGLNEDARTLLAGKKYRGQGLSQAIESLMNLLTEDDYLTESKNTILLSVQNKNTQHSQQLEKNISDYIRASLEQQHIIPNIIDQLIIFNQEEEDTARQYQISPGKIRYINGILAYRHDYTLEQLAVMNMEDLANLFEDADDFGDNDDDREDSSDDEDQDDPEEDSSDEEQDDTDNDDEHVEKKQSGVIKPSNKLPQKPPQQEDFSNDDSEYDSSWEEESDYYDFSDDGPDSVDDSAIDD